MNDKNGHFIYRKGGRTITFKEFEAILDELCVKRFPKKETLDDKKDAIRNLIAGKGPKTAGTTVSCY